MINNITVYFTHKNTYNRVMEHLKEIIDCCGYNDNADTTLFSKGDAYADEYFFDLIYQKNIKPEWMGWTII